MSLVTLLEFTDTISLQKRTSVDSYGYGSYATASTYAARERQKRELVRDPQGQEVLSRMVVDVGSGASPALTDKITLTNAQTPRILQIEEMLDHRNKTYCWRIWTE